jgi:uncharacterized protein
MKLSKVERLQIANQFKILSLLDEHERDHYERMVKIFENGYELQYGDATEHFSEGLSADDCRYVLDVLDMFRMMQRAYDDLEDKSGIKENRVTFLGFDGNHEPALMGYARFFCEDMKRYEDLRRVPSFNSHMSTTGLYRQMLDAWSASADKYRLTQDDLIRITNVTVA